MKLPAGGPALGQATRIPTFQTGGWCWAQAPARWVLGGWIDYCGKLVEGDDTIGLCPDHYAEIVGR